MINKRENSKFQRTQGPIQPSGPTDYTTTEILLHSILQEQGKQKAFTLFWVERWSGPRLPQAHRPWSVAPLDRKGPINICTYNQHTFIRRESKIKPVKINTININSIKTRLQSSNNHLLNRHTNRWTQWKMKQNWWSMFITGVYLSI